jgi:hypothetical protein
MPTAREPAFDLGFREAYQIGQVNRSGENWPPESHFGAFLRPAGEQPIAENPRKPATQRGGRSGGECGSYGNWRKDRYRDRDAYTCGAGNVRDFAARYNAEWLIEKNGYLSPLDARAARLDTSLRCAA